MKIILAAICLLLLSCDISVSFREVPNVNATEIKGFIGVSILLSCIIILLAVLYRKGRSEEKRLEDLVQKRTAEIDEQRKMLKAVTESYKGVIWSINKDGIITTFNGRYLKKIGVTPEFLEGKKLELAIKKSRHLDIIENVYKTFSEGPQDWMSDIDGETFHSNTVPLYDSEKNIVGVVGSTDNATEIIRLQRNLEKALAAAEIASMTDQLTDISNRRSFDRRLDLIWRTAIREKTPASLLMIDLDKFKPYNDTYGHQQGDTLLQIVAKTIKKTIKRPGDLASRWGGEEFAVLLANTDASGAMQVAENIRSNVEKLEIALIDGSLTKTTVSIGVTTQIPTPNSSMDHFISAADDALYDAKKKGRNRVIQKIPDM